MGDERERGFSWVARLLGTVGCGLALGYLAVLGQAMATLEPLGYLYGLPENMERVLPLAPLLALMTLGLATCSVLAWRLKAWQITGRIHYSAPVLLDKFGYCRTISGQSADGRIFIISHEAAVFFDIGAKNGGQPSLKALSGHGITPLKGP